MDKQIEKAKKTIEEGGIVIFPTETAYGIAADATNQEAIEKVYNAKNRPKSKGLTTIVSNLEQAQEFGNLSNLEKKIVEEFMPGPLTLVTNKESNNNLPNNLNEKFVFRISSSPLARELAAKTPITATSANISGESTSYSISDISSELKTATHYILDRGELDKKPTSTIIEVVDNKIIVHRKGLITKQDILEKV